MGRPTDYTPELAIAFCERVAEGESVRSICADPDMPARSSIFKWIGMYPEFTDQYTRAREIGAEVKFDELEELAATATPDCVSVVKLQVDTRKWALSKMMPKKYGDKVQQEIDHRSSDGSMKPTVIEIVAPDDQSKG